MCLDHFLRLRDRGAAFRPSRPLLVACSVKVLMRRLTQETHRDHLRLEQWGQLCDSLAYHALACDLWVADGTNSCGFVSSRN